MTDTKTTAPRRWPLVLVTIAATLIVVLAFGDAIVSAFNSVKDAMTGDDNAADGESGATAKYYTCGMHPWVILPHPGDCPICHMKLEVIDPARFQAELAIDPVVAQNMGVRLATVTKATLTRSLRSVGTVDYDETRVRDVNLKVAGWLEKVAIDYLGAPVKAGDPLFDLYAPELFSAQEEYLGALRRGSDDLAEAARTRLAYFDVSAAEIEAIKERKTPKKALTIMSPWTGVVVAKHANEGMRVEPGMQLYRIADTSKVWVMVSLYEYQLPYVTPGQAAVMSLPYFPGQEFEGRVIYIYPTLDVRTREVKARIEFENPEGLLKPGMFANVDIRASLAKDRVLAPREAVIDTGARQVAFVSLGEGRFEPRTVKLGVEGEGGLVEIVDGLKPGERVVVSGQFLLDSEARMREGLAKMIRGDLASEQEAVVAAAAPTELTRLAPEGEAVLADLLGDYFVIQDTLASDSMAGVADAARAIAKKVDALLAIPVPDAPHFWHLHEEVAIVRGKALEIAGDSGIEDMRLHYADLSVALIKLVRVTGVPSATKAQVLELHCPMYREDQGGTTWLQHAGAVRNPYYGSSMLGCFDKREAMPVAEGNAGGEAP